ncbi:glycoside hydrolase family 3 protein [Aplosporella prunicola CBS 121167]|uniref:beta-glucosidase n=1 Tax=Aplosporella prunicola CBS 121167 TaxID=1176127 RepID=A0A6A6BMC8_9PEZI|nr:glycoside hydrolase family 3 protein [Aplosporella prunicola CBS 121167]KAF2144828.1 glycoside hydrolase family 3 protein [Aplosporella prunicola CBS 121167]
MAPSFVHLALLTLFTNGIYAYSTNYTSQLLSSGTVNLGEWQSAYDEAKTFVEGLTTAEKISLITGSDVGNFSALNFKDSGASILDYFYVTTWPVGSALAMTWDKNLAYTQHKALGSEFRNKGLQVINGPVSQPLGRTPWGGRNAESFGPDSYLNGIFFGQAVRAMNDAGVITGAKHFLLNEQENNRTVSSGGGGGGSPPDGGMGGGPSSNGTSMSGGPSGASNSTSMGGGPGGDSDSSSSTSLAYSSNADDKTIHETYLWPFYDGVKQGLGAVMCALNRVNETYSCENQALLAGLLKTELGFPGFVFGDVGGQKTAFGSANAGMDYASSSTWSNSTMNAGLNNGSLTEARLNDMAIRNVLPSYKLNQQDGSFPSKAEEEDLRDARKNHRQLARQVAASSLAVLKNNGALPLKSPRSMAIFGVHAGAPIAGPSHELAVTGSDDVYQGHAADIGGSGTGSFTYLVTPHYALTTRAMDDGTQLRWIMNDTGYSASSSTGATGSMASFSTGTGASQTYEGYAADMDVCLVFLNAYSGEGADRGQLYDADQDKMVTEVASECNNTVVVINASGPRLVDQWIENENVTALVYGGMLGQESGHAIVDVLYGDVNPSGKLAYTIAKNESDYNVGLCDTAVCTYSEGNYIDYKYFDKYNVTPRYEFGFGLSYTSFSFSDSVTIEKTNASALASPFATGAKGIGGKADMWDTVAKAAVSVKNTGKVAGAETAQLYLGFPAAAGQPVRQLRGFEKLRLEPGREKEVEFELRRRDLSVWDVAAQDWKIVKGTYTFWVGASSRDLKASGTMVV